MQEYATLEMIANAASQGQAFDIPPLGHQVFRVVSVIDRLDALASKAGLV